MSHRKRWHFLWLLFFYCGVFGQQVPETITVAGYVTRYKDIAVRKMQEYGIPASITLAQGILESANGNSELARMANNHFGIKCHRDWEGETYTKDDDARNECFRKYPSASQSFEDHSVFLRTRARYAFLFDLEPSDYKAWAHGLKKAGYATNPKYPELLIRIIEENMLYEYDGEVRHVSHEYPSGRLDTLPAQYRRADGEIIPFGKAVGRKILINNGIKCIVAMKGDSPESIARETGSMPWQIRRYNDLGRGERIREGQMVYLQPKKRKAASAYHTVREQETMQDIAQHYGMKIKHLYRKNRMVTGSQPAVGQKLWLRKTKPVNSE